MQTKHAILAVAAVLVAVIVGLLTMRSPGAPQADQRRVPDAPRAAPDNRADQAAVAGAKAARPASPQPPAAAPATKPAVRPPAPPASDPAAAAAQGSRRAQPPGIAEAAQAEPPEDAVRDLRLSDATTAVP